MPFPVFEESKHPRDREGKFEATGGEEVYQPHPRTKPTSARENMRPATEADRGRLKLPPAWTDVVVSNDSGAALQAIGRDAKGRDQYRYSAEHSSRQAVAKFARAKAFDKELPQIVERMNADLEQGNEEAAVLVLIYKTGFRVGGEGDTGAEKQAYGATTLTADHVHVKGDEVDFEFIGKKGVLIKKTLADPQIAKMIEIRAARGGRLFSTNDGKVRDYLHSIDGEFKVKDFRTWNGTGLALDAISKMPMPADAKAFEAQRKQVGDIVAAHLGNTRIVALDAYIDPHVFQFWQRALEQ